MVSMEWCSCAVVLKTGQCLNSTDKCHNEVLRPQVQKQNKTKDPIIFSYSPLFSAKEQGPEQESILLGQWKNSQQELNILRITAFP